MIWTSLITQGKRELLMSVLVATLIAVVFFHFARFYQESASSWLFTIGWVPVLLNLLLQFTSLWDFCPSLATSLSAHPTTRKRHFPAAWARASLARRGSPRPP